MKNILIIDSYYNSFNGAQKSALSLASLLAEDGYMVTIGSSGNGLFLNRVRNQDENINTKVFKIPNRLLKSIVGSSKCTLFFQALMIIINWFKLLKCTSEFSKNDYVCVNDTRTFLLYLPFLIFTKAKVIWYVRIRTEHEIYSKLGGFVSDFVVCISTSVKNDLVNKGFDQNKIALVKTGFNYREYNEPQNVDFSNSIKFISVGSICERKNQLEVIELFKTLLISLKVDGTLTFVGGAEQGHEYYFDKLTSLVENDEFLRGRVEFRGQIDNVFSDLEASNVFLFSSYCEGLPRSVIEAIHSGLFVISKNVDGISDIITDDIVGFVYEDLEEVKKLVGHSHLFYSNLGSTAKRYRVGFINDNFSNQVFINDFKEALGKCAVS